MSGKADYFFTSLLTIDPAVCTGSVAQSFKKFKLFITTHNPLIACPQTCYKIPHHIKLCSHIIELWDLHMHDLKKKMQVHLLLYNLLGILSSYL